MRTIRQPGPVKPERHLVVCTEAVPVTIELTAGQNVLHSLADKLSELGALSAFLKVRNSAVQQLDYVMPAPSPDEDHTAWWSQTHGLSGLGKIIEACLVFGWRDDGPFFHCHGSWTDETNQIYAGHMLPDRCVVIETTKFTGWLFPDARFEGQFDPETNFTLFQPIPTSNAQTASAALVRLRPNVEIGQQLQIICKELDWTKAHIHGLGSLIGASFADGTTMQSYATEFLVRGGTIDLESSIPGANIDILIVGIEGDIMHGPLLRDANAVLMTCELVLIRSD